jgi:hypothetical protein
MLGPCPRGEGEGGGCSHLLPLMVSTRVHDGGYFGEWGLIQLENSLICSCVFVIVVPSNQLTTYDGVRGHK